jgi:hypothetical protein
MRQEEQLVQRKNIERLVKEGKLPESALADFDAAASRTASRSAASTSDGTPSLHDLPVTVNKGRPKGEYVYQHIKGPLPVPKQEVSWSTLGTPVSFGRARWTVDNASIFSVADGKRLAQTPLKEPTLYERLRAEKMQRAQLQSPVVKGLRLLPEFTPGRAMFWGTVLALWGTAAVVLTTARRLDIHTTEDASDKIRGVFTPAIGWLERTLGPVREKLQSTDLTVTQPSEFSRQLRGRLASGPSSRQGAGRPSEDS